MRIVIEAEVPHDYRSLFRVSIDGIDAGKGLTAMQAQLTAGDAIEGFAFPNRNHRRTTPKGQLVADRRAAMFVATPEPRRRAWPSATRSFRLRLSLLSKEFIRRSGQP